MVQEALALHAMCWLFPANTSHFIQPLDDVIFARLKQLLKSEGQKLPLAHTLSRYELAAALYNAGYRAEQEAFNPRVIIRAFEQTGVWPFNPDQILEDTQLNLSLKAKETKAEYVQATRRSVQYMMAPEAKKSKIKQGLARVQISTLFLPFELLEAEYLTSLEKDHKARKKREAADAKKEESAAKLAARTCGEVDCLKVTRKQSGAKNWT